MCFFLVNLSCLHKQYLFESSIVQVSVVSLLVLMLVQIDILSLLMLTSCLYFMSLECILVNGNMFSPQLFDNC